MASRREAQAKAQKQSALQLLAARRRGERPAGGAGRVPGLSSDSDSDGYSQAAKEDARVGNNLEDSDCESEGSEDENSLRASNSGGNDSSRQPGPALNRLRKAGAPARAPKPPVGPAGAGSDDLAAQLGGLSIKGRDGGRGASSSSSCQPQQPSSRAAVVPHSSRSAAAALPGDPSQAAAKLEASRAERRPAQGAAAAAGEAAEDEADCLVLGEGGEFRLGAELSRKLYPHQVGRLGQAICPWDLLLQSRCLKRCGMPMPMTLPARCWR